MPTAIRHRFAPKPSSRRGFALLITVTLLAFLVLLLVSLASLTRVETQVANNSQDQAKARQNALMALNIALGELQKYTGPDQRTTARSDMDATLANTTTQSGRWLGAYGNGAEADYSMVPSLVSTAVFNASDSKGSQAKLLNWLVSGNEGTSFDPSSHVGAKGNITTPPSSFQFTPSSAVAGLSSSSTALSDSITVGAQPARLLVGPNTAGDSVSDYVVAPLRDISADMPGLGASVPVGRYAWWVGDENAKARLNLPIANSSQQANAFASSQRAAVELVDAVNPSPSTSLSTSQMLDPAGTLSRYDPSSPLIAKILSTDQLSMLSASGSGTLATVSKYRYHDLGLWSHSVLADAYAGGLKKDLSAMLATGATSPADTELVFQPETGSSTNHVGVPTWGQLRSHAQTTASSQGLLSRAPSMAMNAAWSGAPVPTDVGISPVMTYAAFGFRFIAPDGDIVGNRISLAVVPIVVLWNPYTATLRGTDASGNPVRYEVGMRKAFADRIQLQGRPASSGPLGSAYTWGAGNVLGSSMDLGLGSPERYHRFVIECPSAGIPPGASLVFTLANSGENYVAGTNVLRNGFNDNYFAILSGFDRTITAALGAGAFYRVAANGQDRTVNSVFVPQTMYGAGTGGSWGGAGNGWHEAYLGSTGMGSNFPKNEFPWSNSNTTQGIHQSFSLISAPTVGTPPYGSGGGGYALSSGPSGLLQPEGTLATELTSVSPSFRLMLRAVFANAAAANANLTKGRDRWIMQNNIRAVMMVSGSGSMTGVPNQSSWPFDISSPDDLHVASGTSLTQAVNDTTLHEFRPDTQPLLGIGQLQNANLGWLSSSPAYMVGNSNSGNGYVQYESGVLRADRLVKTGAIHGNAPGNKITAVYDQSWLTNRALWDRCFVSTVPHAGTGVAGDTAATPVPSTLANPLYVRNGAPAETDLKDADKAAANLFLAGGFNINSTSEQAWRAVLGGTNRLSHDPTGSNAGGTAWDKITFSRFVKPTTNDSSSPWLGYKRVNEAQVARLAREIVKEVRARGPFVSLADFINRRLYTANTTLQPADTRLKGPIQAAIDAVTTGTEAINSVDPGSPLADFASVNPSYKVISAFRAASTDAFGAGTDTPGTPIPPYGTSAAGVPQFLTQADILGVVGDKLEARSDTFTIRTYGETLDPVNSTPAKPVIIGKAWCEAVVQRVPEYADGSMRAETDLASAPSSTTKNTNMRFGRKYKIISFRWLSANDI